MPPAAPSDIVRTRDTADIAGTLGTISVFHPAPFGIFVEILGALDHTSACPQHSASRFLRVPQGPLSCSSLPWQYYYTCAFAPPRLGSALPPPSTPRPSLQAEGVGRSTAR